MQLSYRFSIICISWKIEITFKMFEIPNLKFLELYFSKVVVENIKELIIFSLIQLERPNKCYKT